MKKWILEKWDWFIYRRAFNTLRRMSERRPGFSYLLELHMRRYNAENPISESVKSATELFHQAMIDHLGRVKK